MTTKGRQVRIRAAPADKGGAIDPQAMMLDRVEHPQAGIGAIARHQHDFNPWLAEMGIEPQQLLHQRKSITGLQHFVFVLDLILTVGFDPLRQIQAMAFTQVEQGSRGDGDHQFIAEALAHGLLLIGLSGCGDCESRVCRRWAGPRLARSSPTVHPSDYAGQ
ncbi:hypothetical protein D3C78_787780 [compost metagenome]